MPTNTFLSLSDNKRDRILDAARRIFTRSAFEEASIQDIVKEAGIPRGSFYQYFDDKEDLYLYLNRLYLEKSIRLHYTDNMDYFMNVLYSDNPKQLNQEKWFMDAINKMQLSMSEDEINFALNAPPAPDRLNRAVLIESARLLYPVLLDHLQSSKFDQSSSDRSILAYFMAFCDSIMADLSTLTQSSEDDIAKEYFSFLRRIFEFCSRDNDHQSSVLNSISSIHFISPDGISLTASIDPLSAWQMDDHNGRDCIWSARLVKSSTKGSISVDFNNLDAEYNGESIINITITNDGSAETLICDGGVSVKINNNYSAIGTAPGRSMVCIIDNGKFLL